jgi:hypothetical protein
MHCDGESYQYSNLTDVKISLTQSNRLCDSETCMETKN